jgi:UDP-N-acetylmuramoyl-L-alanyl-D-glutamate--2,6-diaminopimelate ligase
VRLGQLTEGLEVRALQGDPDVEVTAIAFDSREVPDGALFVCLRGADADGHAFAADAVADGAVAVLVDHDVEVPATRVVVDDTRLAMAQVAATFYDNPSRRLAVIGVTGTNGKTTTTHLIAHALSALGRQCEALGTLTGGFTTPTTPEAPLLQAALAAARDRGDAAVAMEVSSHALVRHRVDGTAFAIAVFTGLSQDHLDEHGTMEDYYAAKRSLFVDHQVGQAVVVVDDEWGRRLADELEERGRPRVTRVSLDLWPPTWELPLPGDHNRRNALCAIAVCRVLGFEPQAAADALASAPAVPGRLERVEAGQPFTAYVDYAHKPGALEAALGAVRGEGRTIAVLGAGGDRDRTKRPEMGRLAATLADVAIFTSDNPRSEEPMSIIGDLLGGVDRAARAEVHVEPDRRAAIALAVRLARPGDTVLVAGKGHETTQEVAGRHEPFDDRDELRRAIGARGPLGSPPVRT